MSVFNRRNAFMGWVVLQLAKPAAKAKARAAARKAGTKKGGVVAASVAAVGAAAAGLAFWRKRRGSDAPPTSS